MPRPATAAKPRGKGKGSKAKTSPVGPAAAPKRRGKLSRPVVWAGAGVGAGVAARAGCVGWRTGCFGGLSPPSYSVLVPSWMATLGVQVTGVAAPA